MTLDSSAVIAVLFRELQHDLLRAKMLQAERLMIGAPTVFESAMVAARMFDARGLDLLAHFLSDLEVEVCSFDDRHWRAATDAFLRYGKGRHPARLNLGDCMTYATARVADLPLLFTGQDFAQTDLAVA